MDKKAAIELSVNVIVIIIISVVIIGLGIALVYKVLNAGGKINCDYSLRQQQELFDRLCLNERLCANGMSSCNSFISMNEPDTIDNGKTGYFLVGIQNSLGITSNFRLVVESSSTPEGYNYPESNISFNGKGSAFPLTVNEKLVKQVIIRMPKNAASGQYVFNVLACTDSTTEFGRDPSCPANYYRYDLKKIYVYNP